MDITQEATTETTAEETTAPDTVDTTETAEGTATDHTESANSLKDLVKNAEKIAAKGKSQPSAKKAATQEAVGTQKPLFTPNYKFTSLDKEFEFDEWAKPLVTSKEVEDNLRKLYTERAGMDHIKAGRQEFATKAQEFEKKYTEQTEALKELGSYVQKGDYDSAFDAMGISKDSILKYAIELAKREQWTPEQKQQWQASREAEVHKVQQSQQAQEFEARQQEFEVQKRTWELDQVLTAPQVTDAQSHYDTALGRQGAFRDFVIQIGQSYAARGQDIPVQQAVGEALNHIKPFIGGVSQGQQAAPAQRIATPNTKPTIPSVEGRGVSPVKKAFTSFDEMKKYAKELSLQE